MTILARTLLLGVFPILCHADIMTLPHPSAAMPPDQTVVWSPLFQAAWDKLNTQLGGPPTRIDPPNELMTQLDTFQFKADEVMPEGSWKAWAGPATQEFLKQVNKEAASITKEANGGPFTLTRERDDGLAAFGLLDRNIEFKKPLYRSAKKPMAFMTRTGAVSSQFFGVKGDFSAGFFDMIRVLSYEPAKKSHALELICKANNETVIFYLPPAAQNFTTACATVRAWKAAYKKDPERDGALDDPELHRNDELQVPYVSLDVKTEFPELTAPLRFHPQRAEPWKISRAEQLTRFELHEKGARVRIETSAANDPFGAPPTPPPMVPRQFIYDRPFFVFLWRDKAEWPYFGAWIGDASALKPFP